MTEAAVNLVGKSRTELERLFVAMGEQPFRARQVMRWLYTRRVLDPQAMTDLSLALRERLTAAADFRLPEILACERAADGVIKWQLAAGLGQAIETVFIPEDSRGTLCVSSQVGCALNCSFCATGHQGFNRNLDAGEYGERTQFLRHDDHLFKIVLHNLDRQAPQTIVTAQFDNDYIGLMDIQCAG